MKKLFTLSVKAKIGATFITLTIMFGFCGCSSPTSSDTTITDEYYVGTFGPVEFRVENMIYHEAASEMFRFTVDNIPMAALVGVLDGRTLNTVIITSIGAPGSTSAEGPIVNGVIRGVLAYNENLLTLIVDAITQTPPVAINAIEEEIFCQSRRNESLFASRYIVCKCRIAL